MRATIGVLLFASSVAFAYATTPARASAPAPECLRYEPDTSVITGTLSRQQFYGAPGFGEHPDTDQPEVGFYLAPTLPLCTVVSARGKSDEPLQDVKQVQIVLDSAGYAKLRPMLGQTVSLRGTLFAAFTGHHHAPLLLNFIAVLPARKTQ